MTKASDNAFPSILITEGTEPAAPAAGKQRLYIDSTTHKLKRTDSSGTDVDIEAAAGGSGTVTTVKNEGSNLSTAVVSIDFVGSLVNATGTTAVTATIGPEFATASAIVATSQTTTSTSFADLATVGPSATVTVGVSGKVKISAKAQLNNNTANKWSAVGVVGSGANTVAAFTMLLQSNPIAGQSAVVGSTTILTGLSTGATTFKLQYIVEAGTGTFINREIIVEPVL